MDKWFNVNKDIRVWAGHSDAQKQGWIYAPAAIRAIEEYKGSYRFEARKVDRDGSVNIGEEPGHPEFWVRVDDVSTLPYGPEPTLLPIATPIPLPTPSEVSDADLGATFRLIVNFVRGK